MPKKLVYSSLIFLIATTLFLLFLDTETTGELVYIEYLEDAAPIPNNKALDLVKKLNQKNSKIKSFYSDDIRIKIEKVPFKLRAFLCYEKKQNFRMIVKSVVGRELDIGSNSKLFWFWSRRMEPPTLNYADYRDLYKTCLKTPLHPLWLMESLGINEIPLNTTVSQKGKYITISEPRQSTMNTMAVKKTVIDAEKMLIVGHYLFESGVLISSAEVTEFSNGLPKTMVIIWHSENVTMYWNLQNTTINQEINPSNWIMPNMKNKINLAEPSSHSTVESYP